MNITDYCIKESSTVVDAMKLLDKTAKKVLFIIDDGKLKAAITDGDIRRWILKNGSLEESITQIANYNPKYVKQQNASSARAIMQEYSIEILPVVDEDMQVLSFISLLDNEDNTRGSLNIPVVIMAGGLGTRLYPYTKVLPKPLIPVGEIPISEHIINRFYKAGCDEFYLVLNHKKNMIKAYYNDLDKDYNVYYSDEDIPLGTGGGLGLLKGKINTTFALSNCDILIRGDYQRIMQHHKENDNIITIVCSLKHIRIPYGVIEVGSSGEITDMREKPELSFLTNTGMYIVEPRVIDEIENNKVISFPDIISKYRDAGEKIGVYPISENSWLDMGQFDTMEDMKRKLDSDE